MFASLKTSAIFTHNKVRIIYIMLNDFHPSVFYNL